MSDARKRTYSLTTSDPEAFRRLVDAAADIGTFSMQVVLMKDTPQAKPMESVSTGQNPDPKMLLRN